MFQQELVMESLLGFQQELHQHVEEDTKSSNSQRLVPWLSWDEWIFIKEGLFSDSPHSVSSALKRISAWRGRGCLPVPIEVTASIIEIQHKDPFFKVDKSNEASLSEEMLAMLYCMTIMRLVNGAVEKTRKKELVSIAVAADAIGIPRMLIDIRHEGSHRELPSLKVVRSASVKALDWLKSYYWEPQSRAIPFQGEGNVKVKKEIKAKIRELAICLKANGGPHACTSPHKGKRANRGDLLLGRNKLLTLKACKNQTSQSGGSYKKQITKILKSVHRLYSSFSSEIVSVLLDYLLKALRSSEFEENADDKSVGNVLADWKLVVLKLWNKEPELLLNLLKAVLGMIETQGDMNCEGGNPCVGISKSRAEFRRRDHLSFLFKWLIGIFSKVPSAAAKIPKVVLHELLRQCLLISQLCNMQLMDSALHLAELMGDKYMLERVKRLTLIGFSNLHNAEDDNSSSLTSKNIFQFEKSVHEAAQKLELIKQQILKNKSPTAMDCETKKSQTWALAKSWNPCPIGMLPRAAGSSGCLPVLDNIDHKKQNDVLDNIDHKKQNEVSESKENGKMIQLGAKRDATLDIQVLDNSTVKKMREAEEFGKLNGVLPTKGKKGSLWQRVMKEELQANEYSSAMSLI